jgi:hypothetical protein
MIFVTSVADIFPALEDAGISAGFGNHFFYGAGRR